MGEDGSGAGRGAAVARAGAMAAAGIVLALVMGCARPAPEEALRNAVAGVQQSIEERDAGALRRYLSGDFIGPNGMDRDQARRTAALYMMQHQSVGLTIGPMNIDLEEPHATVRFSAALTGGSGRLLPDRANLYQVEPGWRMEGGDWKITSARWTRAL